VENPITEYTETNIKSYKKNFFLHNVFKKVLVNLLQRQRAIFHIFIFDFLTVNGGHRDVLKAALFQKYSETKKRVSK